MIAARMFVVLLDEFPYDQVVEEEKLAELIYLVCEDKWDRCMDILPGFLWWDYVCASYAKEVWNIIHPTSIDLRPAINVHRRGAVADSINKR